jgi:hypothetical protein
MRIISHRGNLNGPKSCVENSIEAILKARDLLYDVEIDVWNISNTWFLGHDFPEYQVAEDFIKQDGLWCHAKNIDALLAMSKINIKHYFWHQNDDFTLTSSGFIWTFPDKPITPISVAVMPELSSTSFQTSIDCYAICTDFVTLYSACDF